MTNAQARLSILADARAVILASDADIHAALERPVGGPVKVTTDLVDNLGTRLAVAVSDDHVIAAWPVDELGIKLGESR